MVCRVGNAGGLLVDVNGDFGGASGRLGSILKFTTADNVTELILGAVVKSCRFKNPKVECCKCKLLSTIQGD